MQNEVLLLGMEPLVFGVWCQHRRRLHHPVGALVVHPTAMYVMYDDFDPSPLCPKLTECAANELTLALYTA